MGFTLASRDAPSHSTIASLILIPCSSARNENLSDRWEGCLLILVPQNQSFIQVQCVQSEQYVQTVR